MNLDLLISLINAGTSLLISTTLVIAMLSKRVHDGIIIKIGLGSMALGFLVVAMHMLKITGADVQGLQRALLLINSGLAVVIFGYVHRVHGAGHAFRRITDWADIDDALHDKEDARAKSAWPP
jgi:hypothetical protein